MQRTRQNVKRQTLLSARIRAGTLFLASVVLLAVLCSCTQQTRPAHSTAAETVITFRSFGEGASFIGMIDLDGANEQYIQLDETGRYNWHLGPMFSDGRRIIAVRSERTSVGEQIAGRQHVDLFIYDFKTGDRIPLLTENRPAPDTACIGILPGEKRLLLHALVEARGRTFISDLDGGNLIELTTPEDGYVYCETLSPDKKRVAFHVLAKVSKYCPSGTYSINTIDMENNRRYLVDSEPNHLFFGPAWSPDSERVAYLDCLPHKDSAHFYADICVAKADGTLRRNLTRNQSHWFGTVFGSREYRSGGSNCVQWTPDGRILYTRLIPGSVIDSYFDPSRPNHEEYVYAPHLARGGTQLCLIDPHSGEVTELTPKEELTWDFMATSSPDGKDIAFLRHRVGDFPTELWIMNSDGSGQRLLTRGYQDKGVSLAPRFLEIRKKGIKIQ